MEKKAYAETAIERYKDIQTYVINQIEKINVFQNLYGFKNFTDITIRCTNSEVNCIRYFNKQNINYNEEPNDLVLYAYQYYVQDKLSEAIYELNRYIEELEMLFIGKQLTLKNRIKELFNHEDNSKKIFSVSQNHVENYLRIAEEISDIDIVTDIDKIIRNYIDHKHEEFMSLEGFPEEIKNKMYQSTITIASNELRKALKNLNLYHGIYAMDDEIIKTLQKDDVKTLKRK